MSASCADCTPAQREERGCEGGNELQWTDPITEDEYYVCPLRFITNQIVGFSNEYNYQLEFPASATGYRGQAARFIEAVADYKRNIRELGMLARGESLPEENKNG